MIAREAGATVRVTCHSCDGEGTLPSPYVDEPDACSTCGGDGSVLRELAEPIRLDAEAVREQLAQGGRR